MVVLAFETVTPRGSVAVWKDDVCHARAGEATPAHAGRLPGVWMDALVELGLTLDDVDRLVVVSGPGSFTGVRIGMASAQGLAATRGWQVAAVPTLHAIAECWRASQASQEDGPIETVVACLDGLRGEVFVQTFRCVAGRVQAEGDALVTKPEELDVPSDRRVALVGSGAVRYASVFAGRFEQVADVPEPIAGGACRLVAGADWPLMAPQDLRPIYVRRPDVELARERGRPRVR